jgi:hypothetical protein
MSSASRETRAEDAILTFDENRFGVLVTATLASDKVSYET